MHACMRVWSCACDTTVRYHHAITPCDTTLVIFFFINPQCNIHYLHVVAFNTCFNHVVIHELQLSIVMTTFLPASVPTYRRAYSWCATEYNKLCRLNSALPTFSVGSLICFQEQWGEWNCISILRFLVQAQVANLASCLVSYLLWVNCLKQLTNKTSP